MVWTATKGECHPSLTEEQQRIEAYIPLVSNLFPGINYYSTTGFWQVMRDCVKPALEKQFPQYLKGPAENISGEVMVEVQEFLPSRGHEWEDEPSWRTEFHRRLAA